MKSLILALSMVLAAAPAFAITRTVICKDNSGAERSPLVIQLRGGNAMIFECGDTECPADAEPVQTAVLSMTSMNSVEYRVLSGREPAIVNFMITFPDTAGGNPILTLDGVDSDMSCY